MLARVILLFVIARCAFAYDPALVLRYSFNENFASAGKVTDLSGNGNDGYQMNPTNWITASASGALGSQGGLWVTNFFMTNGASVYEASQYIAVTNLSANLQKMTNFTVSFWVKFHHKAGVSPSFQANVYLIDGAYNVGPSNSWRIGRLLLPDQTRISMRVYAAATVDSDGDQVIQGPQRSIGGGSSGGSDNGTAQLDHYALTLNCTSNISAIYLNGALVATNTCRGVPWFQISGLPNNWLCIGANKHNSGTYAWGDDSFPNDAYFNGIFDEFRIYNRNLTAEEIAGLYDGTFDNENPTVALTGTITTSGGVTIR